MNYYPFQLSLTLVSSIIICSCSKDDVSTLSTPLSTDFEGKFVMISPSTATTSPGEIAVLDANGLEQITFNLPSNTIRLNATWIHQGESILYHDSPVCFCPDLGTYFVIKQDGSGIKQLPGRPGKSLGTFLSPDEKWATANLFFSTLVFSLDEELNPDQIDSIDGNASSLNAGGWAPDSERFLMTMPNGNGGLLAIYHVATKTITQLYSVDSKYPGLSQSAWSYNSEKVAFILDGDVYAVNADGTGIQNLTISSDEAIRISWVNQKISWLLYGAQPTMINPASFYMILQIKQSGSCKP